MTDNQFHCNEQKKTWLGKKKKERKKKEADLQETMISFESSFYCFSLLQRMYNYTTNKKGWPVRPAGSHSPPSKQSLFLPCHQERHRQFLSVVILSATLSRHTFSFSKENRKRQNEGRKKKTCNSTRDQRPKRLEI